MLEFPLLLIDTEYTADRHSKTRNWKGEHKEIIQIGLIAFGEDFSVHDSLRVYVRPEKNPTLTAFIKELTGIRQADIHAAQPLQEVWKKVVPYFVGRSLYAFGDDAKVIEDNFVLNGHARPWECRRIVDIGPYLETVCDRAGIDMAQYSSGTLCQAFGIVGDPAHDALNDMKNLRLFLMELRARRLL